MVTRREFIKSTMAALAGAAGLPRTSVPRISMHHLREYEALASDKTMLIEVSYGWDQINDLGMFFKHDHGTDVGAAVPQPPRV